MKLVHNGIPQGSPISLILAAFYTAELLEIFTPPDPTHNAQPFPHPDNSTKVHLLMYVDDGKLYVSSTSLNTKILLLKAAYLKAEQWLRDAGLSSDYSKQKIIHYSCQRDHNSNPSISNS